jgi:hypothetical protein
MRLAYLDVVQIARQWPPASVHVPLVQFRLWALNYTLPYIPPGLP